MVNRGWRNGHPGRSPLHASRPWARGERAQGISSRRWRTAECAMHKELQRVIQGSEHIR